MKSNIIKSVLLIVFFLSITSVYAGSFTQKDSTSQKQIKIDKSKYMDKCTEKDMSKHMKMDKSMNTSKTMKMGAKKAEKVINLKAIDKNKDGKVYQCPMDFDVLSDKSGKDPKCGMALVEVTLDQAKKNLTDHGFKVK